MTMSTEKQRLLLGSLAGLFAGVLILLVLALVIRSWSTIDAIRETQQTNTGTFDRLIDCTTEGHPCYERQQRQTGAVVGTLNETTIAASAYAAACAKSGLRTAEQIRRCVLHQFDKRKGAKP